jgi:hypothetical protein
VIVSQWRSDRFFLWFGGIQGAIAYPEEYADHCRPSLIANPMLKSLKIENYRGFQSFELQQLGRINLLVGENNSGKTSVLEAVKLLYSLYDLEPLNRMMASRGELFWVDDRRSASSDYQLDACHLFHSHEISLGSKLSVVGKVGESQDNVIVSINPRETLDHGQADTSTFMNSEADELKDLDFVVNWSFSDKSERKVIFPLSPNGGLSNDYARRKGRPLKDSPVKTLLVSSSSLTSSEMLELFDQVVLKPEEDTVVHALQAIDPTIERIASVGSGFRSVTRGGFIVRRSESEQPAPIGSMGDGIWRMLGLALAAACTKGGILLVDEIDTGLHFTTLSKMWKMIWEIAKQSNVQIFATTHSDDCVRSLAELAEVENVAEDEITIHRIERNKPHSVIFDAEMAVIAANQGIEVR